jgi:outer membrane lipopolysaccharide assembly protein LptE/RlpB
MVRTFIQLLLLLLLIAGLAACELSLPSTTGAQQALCQALGDLRTALAGLSDIDTETTIGELRALLDRLDGAVQLVRTANQALRQAGIDELLAAYDDLVVTIRELPDQAAVGEARVQIQNAVAEVQAAFDRVRSDLNCAE